jgi:methylmalonyl-CoA/ethylmalonyl-CoA epimerase
MSAPETIPASDNYRLNWTPAGSFHHVGFVVASIAQSARSLADALDADWDEQIIHDPNQAVRVTFLRSRRAGDPLFELVEPAGENTPVLAFLEQGGGLHHICYEVESLEAALTRIRACGALIARQPKPAVAFGGRRIAWVYTKQKLLIEYLERSLDGK